MSDKPINLQKADAEAALILDRYKRFRDHVEEVTTKLKEQGYIDVTHVNEKGENVTYRLKRDAADALLRRFLTCLNLAMIDAGFNGGMDEEMHRLLTGNVPPFNPQNVPAGTCPRCVNVAMLPRLGSRGQTLYWHCPVCFYHDFIKEL